MSWTLQIGFVFQNGHYVYYGNSTYKLSFIVFIMGITENCYQIRNFAPTQTKWIPVFQLLWARELFDSSHQLFWFFCFSFSFLTLLHFLSSFLVCLVFSIYFVFFVVPFCLLSCFSSSKLIYMYSVYGYTSTPRPHVPVTWSSTNALFIWTRVAQRT